MMDLPGILTGLPVGAVVGFALTLLADPIKVSLKDWIDRRQLRKALYAEMAHNYSGLLTCLIPQHLALLEHRFAENVCEYTRVQVYQDAKQQHHLFLGVKEWSQITRIYEPLLRIIASDLPSAVKASQAIAIIIVLEESILSNFLSLKLFSKVNPDISGSIREIKYGKRKRSAEVYQR